MPFVLLENINFISNYEMALFTTFSERGPLQGAAQGDTQVG